MFFMATSNGLCLSNPNSIRDQGETRNCQYVVNDEIDLAKNVTWRDIVRTDRRIERILDTVSQRSVAAKGSFFLSKDQKSVKQRDSRASRRFATLDNANSKQS